MARWATFQHFCDSLYVYSKPHPSLIFSFAWNSPWALNKLCLSTSYDWLTTACDLWRPILIELARCSHQTQPQTLQWESLRSAALIWKSALFEQSREPFWSSNRSRDQLCKQRLVRIKCRAPLCHCHNEEENTTYHLLLRGNWSGWSRSNKKTVCNDVEAFGRQVSAKSAADHMDKENNFWRRTLWSDEKMELFGHNERWYVWRPLTPRTPYLLVPWGCFTALKKVNGIMKVERNQKNLKSFARRLGLGCSWVFQKDNDCKHTSTMVKEWLKQARI